MKRDLWRARKREKRESERERERERNKERRVKNGQEDDGGSHSS